jgi:Tfp pilus assembly PilM family ATPase/Tfp pilus assembly protein PilN
MPKRCIGIDIGRTHVCAAQVVRTAAGLRVEKAFAMQTRRSSDSLPATLRSLTERYGFDRRAEVAVALPLHVFFFAAIETDTPGLETLQASEAAGVKDYFPIPAQEIIAQVCSTFPMGEGKTSVLVAASSRPQLAAGLQSLRESKITPLRLDTPLTAIQATILANHPPAATGLAIILYVDSSALGLAVMNDGHLLLVRNIPLASTGDPEVERFVQQIADVVAQEIEITWRRLFGHGPDPGLRVFLAAPAPLTAALTSAIQDKTSGQVVPVDPYACVARGEGVDADLPIGVAQGLAIRALEPEKAEHIDFLAAYRARTRPQLRPARELTVCAALAAAVALVWTVGLFLQRSSLETRHGQLKQQMAAAFHEAVPQEQNIVDPTAQLQQQLDALGKQRDLLTSLHPERPAPLEILSALSRSTPAAGALKLQDVLIGADTVRITGTCDSFTTLSQWQRLLEAIPGLQVVDVPRSTKDAQSGKVGFTIALSIGGSKA